MFAKNPPHKYENYLVYPETKAVGWVGGGSGDLPAMPSMPLTDCATLEPTVFIWTVTSSYMQF